MSNYAVFFSDLHIHNYRKFDGGTGKRLDNTLKVIEYIYDFSCRNGIDTIVFSGDMFDQPKILPVIVVNKVVTLFTELVKNHPNIHLVCITGNHDQATVQLLDVTAETSLQFLALLFPENIKLIDGSYVDVRPDVRIYGLPYFEYKEHFISQLDVLLASDGFTQWAFSKILLTHQVLGKDVPYDCDIACDDARFEPFGLVANGHIHKTEWLHSNVLNVGSPIHRDVDDEGLDKGFFVFDLTALEKYRFISLNSKFPTIITKVYGEDLTDYEATQYIQWVPAPTISTDAGIVNVDSFKPILSADVLLVNYCKEIGREDMIDAGLSLLSNRT